MATMAALLGTLPRGRAACCGLRDRAPYQTQALALTQPSLGAYLSCGDYDPNPNPNPSLIALTLTMTLTRWGLRCTRERRHARSRPTVVSTSG